MPRLPEPHGFMLRDALIGAAVAAVLIELAPPGMELSHAHLSAGMMQPGVKPAHGLAHPAAKPKSCHDQ